MNVSDERLAELAADRWTGPGLSPRPFDYDRRHKFVDDDELAAFESRHGHDPRLKCYPEFGCQAIEYEASEIAAELLELRKAKA